MRLQFENPSMARAERDRMLRQAAERAKTRPEYMAWVLARYMAMTKTTEMQMVDHLGVSWIDWMRLLLCLRPRPESFAEDVFQISHAFCARAGKLAEVVWVVETDVPANEVCQTDLNRALGTHRRSAATRSSTSHISPRPCSNSEWEPRKKRI